jgi:ATP-binding cassette subfamily B protein
MKPTNAAFHAPERAAKVRRVSSLREVFREVPGTLRLVWAADRAAALQLIGLTALLALLPAGIAWVGKLIVDGVVAASAGDLTSRARVPWRVALELGLMAIQLGLLRLAGLRRDLLRATLGNLVNEQILQKALTLELSHFEDS